MNRPTRQWSKKELENLGFTFSYSPQFGVTMQIPSWRGRAKDWYRVTNPNCGNVSFCEPACGSFNNGYKYLITFKVKGTGLKKLQERIVNHHYLPRFCQSPRQTEIIASAINVARKMVLEYYV